MTAIAPALPYISAALGAVSAFTSYRSQSEAADAQKEAARQAKRDSEINALNQERKTAMELENLKIAQSKEEAFNRAKAASSGIAVSADGSFGLSLEEQKNTNIAQYNNYKQSGASEADAIRRGGNAAQSAGMSAASQTKAGAWSSLVGGATDLYSTGQTNDWWK